MKRGGEAGKTWCSSTAKFGLVQIPDITSAGERVDVVHSCQGLGVFGFGNGDVWREGIARVSLD